MWRGSAFWQGLTHSGSQDAIYNQGLGGVWGYAHSFSTPPLWGLRGPAAAAVWTWYPPTGRGPAERRGRGQES